MIVIPPNEKEVLEKYCPHILAIDELSEFLDEFDTFMGLNGFDDDDEMTEFGYLLQDTYDVIYALNKK